MAAVRASSISIRATAGCRRARRSARLSRSSSTRERRVVRHRRGRLARAARRRGDRGQRTTPPSGQVNTRQRRRGPRGARGDRAGDARFANATRRCSELFERRGRRRCSTPTATASTASTTIPSPTRSLCSPATRPRCTRRRTSRRRRPGTLYINTVESDLNAARARRGRIGYTPILTAVGDKWVLQQAAREPDTLRHRQRGDRPQHLARRRLDALGRAPARCSPATA